MSRNRHRCDPPGPLPPTGSAAALVLREGAPTQAAPVVSQTEEGVLVKGTWGHAHGHVQCHAGEEAAEQVGIG